jgi:hypothetical protein
MSTDLKSRTTDVSLTRFWGGRRGSCVQVTMPRTTKLDPTDQFFTSLQLTREQAMTLARDLLDFACEDEQEQVRDVDPCDDRDFQTFWEDCNAETLVKRALEDDREWIIGDDDNALEEEF